MTLLAVGRVLLALVFLLAGIGKLSDRAGTRRAILAFGVPPRLVPSLAWLLPVAELLVGIALVPAATAPWGAAGALILLTLFLGAIGWNLARGRHPDCRCFGQLRPAPIGWKIVARNLVLAGVAAVLVAQPAQPLGPGLLGWLDALKPGERLALGLALAACTAAAAQAWLLTNLLRQNGRLLLRMDELEARLVNGAEPATPEREQPAREAPFGLPLNERAPEFELPDLDGATVSLEGLRSRGRPVLLLFMDPGCGPCAALVPDVAKWRRDLGQALTVAILSRGSAEVNRKSVGAKHAGAVLLQRGDEVAERYQALATPSALLVDATGRIASPLAQGAEAIRRLAARFTPRGPISRPERAAAGTTATVSLSLLATVALVGAGAARETSTDDRAAAGWVLQVQAGDEWRTWWRADSAPAVWHQPVAAVLDATSWSRVATGIDLGEVIISGGSLALRTRIILARFDLRRYRMVLSQPPAQPTSKPSWSIDSADGRAILAFNAGQFGKSGAWGWLVRAGRELQAPRWGPLSMAVAVTADGEARFVAPDSIPALRRSGAVREAFQSYPALLVDDGRVPGRLREPARVVDLGHRDIRLSLCRLGDGRVLLALTRFDGLGRVFGTLPLGLTLPETAAVMGALGCRRAVSLDGGLSAQLLVRPEAGPARRWTGWRNVPVGIELVPRT